MRHPPPRAPHPHHPASRRPADPPTIPLQRASTAALLDFVRRQARRGTRMGDDPVKARTMPDDQSTEQEWGTLKDWMDYTVDLFYAPGERWRTHVRDELEHTADQLTDFSTRTIQKGSWAAGNVASEWARRAALAAADIGKGVGDGWANFWGYRPGTAMIGAAIIGLVMLAAGVFLLTTPGGQALMFGSAHGYRALLAGAGGAIPIAAEMFPAAIPATTSALGDVVPHAIKALGVLV